MAKTQKWLKRSYSRVARSVSVGRYSSFKLTNDAEAAMRRSALKAAKAVQTAERARLDPNAEWTEAQTLAYLDDLIERNSEALDALAKL